MDKKINRFREFEHLPLNVIEDLEKVVLEEMEPLDLRETGESIGLPEDEIQEDLNYLSSTKDKINRTNELSLAIKKAKAELASKNSEYEINYYERMGHLFEGFLYTHLGDSKIFKDVILHKTSDFDDIKNGVDFIIEYKNPDDPKSYIALAMDASFSMSSYLIRKKMERSMQDIGNNKLSKVKYFQFDEDAEESKTGMPRVVVGVDEERTKSLLQRWHSEEKTDVDVNFSEDPVWTTVALQIKEQLKMFVDEASYHNRPELVSICKKYLRALEVSLRLNSDLVKKHNDILSKDGTSIAINGFCEYTKNERSKTVAMHQESANARRDDELFESIFSNR